VEKAMKRLVVERLQRGWSQAELARRTGSIHPAEMSKIERAIVRPYPSQREKIAKALGLAVKDLFTPDGDLVDAEQAGEAVRARRG